MKIFIIILFCSLILSFVWIFVLIKRLKKYFSIVKIQKNKIERIESLNKNLQSTCENLIKKSIPATGK